MVPILVSHSILICIYYDFSIHNICVNFFCFLLQNGCDVNSQSYSGNTALHSACGRGQVDTVRLLLKSGADSSLKNYHNDTPVMVAKNKKVSNKKTVKENMPDKTDRAEILFSQYYLSLFYGYRCFK